MAKVTSKFFLAIFVDGKIEIHNMQNVSTEKFMTSFWPISNCTLSSKYVALGSINVRIFSRPHHPC